MTSATNMGIYVVAEANVESHGMGYGDKTLAKNPLFAKAHMERNRRNVQRGYNHPVHHFTVIRQRGRHGSKLRSLLYLDQERRQITCRAIRTGTDKQFTDIYCPMYRDYKGSEKEYCKGDIDKPLIQCEYAHAMGNSQGDSKNIGI